LVKQKLGVRAHRAFLPPIPDRLFQTVEAYSDEEREAVYAVAHSFMQSMRRMTVPERVLVAAVFNVGCPAELPENMHVSLDLVRRDLGMPPAETLQTLRGLRSLGFVVSTRESEEDENDDEFIVIKWWDQTVYDDDYDELILAHERSTEIAGAMLRLATDQYCSDHTRRAVEALDFSALSSSTS